MRARKAFALTLQDFRLDQGLSQDKLAAGAEVDRTQVSAIERELHDPTLFTQLRLIFFLKVKPSVFFRAWERHYYRDTQP